jgi:hypothetical protein
MAQALRHKSIPVSGNYIAEKIPHPRESILFRTTFIFFYTVIEKRSMYKPATEGKGKSHKLRLAPKQ